MQYRFLIRALKARFRNQAAELSAIRAGIPPGGLVCDIGANKGSYLYWMSRWAGRVVAFEPQPGLAAYLDTACETLRMTNVVVERQGVSDQSGTRTFYMPSVNSPEASLVCHGTSDTMTIQVVALDDYFASDERVALLKIDVEGGELDVLKGAERILRDHRPVLVFESEQRHLSEGVVADALTFLAERGYRGEFIHGNLRLPIEAFDPAVHQAETTGEFWRAPNYCNNFVFTPSAQPTA